MDKEEFEFYEYDKKPKFEKDHSCKNIPYLHYDMSGFTLISMYHLGNDGLPCHSEYRNGILTNKHIYDSIESMKDCIEKEKQLFDLFYEWMKEYEKNNAKIIGIRK